MKKVLFTLFLSIIFIVFIKINANMTVVLGSSDYYPKGLNYIDPTNFYIAEKKAEQTIYKSLSLIKVKPSTVYVVEIAQYQDIFFTDVIFTGYDFKKSTGAIVTIISKTQREYYFFTGPTTEYIDIQMIFEHLPQFLFGRIDNEVVFYEKSKNNGYVANQNYPYAGADIDNIPVMNGQAVYITTNVDSPYSLTELSQKVKAYDCYEGDISNRISIVEDKYSANIKKTGMHKITFQVADSNTNTSILEMFVNVVDTVKPTVSGTTQYETNQKNKISYAMIEAGFTISDNYNQKDKIKVEIFDDYYSDYYNKPGNYTLKLKATDEAQNYTVVTINISVKDSTAPVISYEQEIAKLASTVLTVESIRQMVRAIDDVDGDISNQIYIVNDGYTANSTKQGTWTIRFGIRDKANNYAYCDVYVRVIDDIPPLFFIGKSIINIDIKEKMIDTGQIIQSIMKIKSIPEDTEIKIITDEYSNNIGVSGKYMIKYQIYDNTEEIEVNIVTDLYAQMSQITQISVIEKILNFLKGLFYDLGKLIVEGIKDILKLKE